MSGINVSVNTVAAKEMAARCVAAGLVPFLQGSPGMGKSAIIHQVAEQFNLQLIDLRLSQCEPSDLLGLPNFKDGKATYVPFDTFPLRGDELPAGKDGWLLFLDEFNSATKSTQGAAYKLCLDRMVGTNHLHDNVAVICAGNLATDKAIVTTMSTAMQSRLVHIELRMDNEAWQRHAAEAGYDSRIIGFLNFKKSMLHDFKADHSDKTFACPRTWEFVSKLVKGCAVSQSDLPLLAGTVGTAAAHQFISFCELYQELPKLEDIINHPETTPVPAEAGVRYAVASYIADNISVANGAQITKYLARMPSEFQVVSIRIANSRDRSLVRIPEVAAILKKVARLL